MLVRLYVPLTQDEIGKLVSLAHAERRRPQDQAAHLLAVSLGNVDHESAPDDHLRQAGTPNTKRALTRLAPGGANAPG